MPRWIDGFEPETLGLTISVGQSVRNSARFAQGLRKPRRTALAGTISGWTAHRNIAEALGQPPFAA